MKKVGNNDKLKLEEEYVKNKMKKMLFTQDI